MSVVRFEIDITPYVEKELMYNTEEEKLVVFFMSLVELLKSAKNFVVIVLPNSLKSSFYQSEKLKIILKDYIEDFTSNIIFMNLEKKDCCPLDCVNECFEGLEGEDLTVPKNIINALIDKKFPLMVDYKKRLVVKKECDKCKEDVLCKDRVEIMPFSDLSKKITPYLKNIEGKLAGLFKNNSFLSISHIRYAAFVQAFFHGIESVYFKNINELYATKGFLKDIRGVSATEFKNISFCMFRAKSFPSSQNVRECVKYSIDWHDNEIKQEDGFDLDRCDILAANRTGHKVSGASRVLIAKKNGKSYFVAYDPKHEFSITKIRTRIIELKRELDS